MFVITEQSIKEAIQHVGLTDRKTGELYYDLMNMTVVYVKDIIKAYNEPNSAITKDLYIFSRFFAVSSQAEADQFDSEFGETVLGRELIGMYNTTVANTTHLAEVEQSTYFISRLNEAQLAVERDKAERKGTLRGIEQTAINTIKLLNLVDPDMVVGIGQGTITHQRAKELIRLCNQQ